MLVPASLPPTRRSTGVLLTVAASSVALFALYNACGDEFIQSMYDRRSPITFLNNVIANTDGGGLDYYRDKGRLYFGRFLLVWIAAGLTMAAWVGRRQFIPVLTDFFVAPSHPLNLALFRIVLFVVLMCAGARSQAVWYATLPRELLVPPDSLGRWLCTHPFRSEVVRFATVALMAVCVTGIMGLWSRTSALLASILAFYVLGIPQCFGKVNHDEHHLIWFGLLLAASPSGDALSVDAALRAWQGGCTPEPSPAYGLPIRLAWILFGVIYFFPGFWKVWHCGVHWGLGDNLRHHLYDKWFELGGWTPFFRIDLHPLLLQTVGMATLLFELGFIFLIFFRKTRRIAVLAGLAFHSSTNVFMRISFWPLLGLYPVFVDWHRVLVGLGRWLLTIPLVVAASSGWQRRLAVHESTAPPPAPSLSRSYFPAALVGGALIVINFVYGAMLREHGWPFACYPTFAQKITKPEITRLQVEVHTMAGAAWSVPEEFLHGSMSSDRYAGLLRSIMACQDQHQKEEKLRAFWGLSRRTNPMDAALVRIYQTKYSSVPEDALHGPLHRKLLIEFRP